VLAERVSAATAYRQKSAGYDEEAGGGLFAVDEPVVAGCLDGRAPGVALDAACGTGRFAEFLARRGHRVIGTDTSPDMLALARRRVPGGEFLLAPLDRLPLPDDSVDVITCALALVHVPRLDPVLVYGVGPIGLYSIMALKLAGAGPIVAAGRSAGRRSAPRTA